MQQQHKHTHVAHNTRPVKTPPQQEHKTHAGTLNKLPNAPTDALSCHVHHHYQDAKG